MTGVQHRAATLLLKDDPEVIARYEAEHRNCWPAVVAALRRAGVTEMRIFRLGRRLFMYYEAVPGFDPTRDFQGILEDPEYRRWIDLMEPMQEPDPERQPGEWWAEMATVFDLSWPHLLQGADGAGA